MKGTRSTKTVSGEILLPATKLRLGAARISVGSSSSFEGGPHVLVTLFQPENQVEIALTEGEATTLLDHLKERIMRMGG